MRDLSQLIAVNDIVFNQKDFKLYTIKEIKGDIFVCENNDKQLIELDVTQGNTLTKVKL